MIRTVSRSVTVLAALALVASACSNSEGSASRSVASPAQTPGQLPNGILPDPGALGGGVPAAPGDASPGPGAVPSAQPPPGEGHDDQEDPATGPPPAPASGQGAAPGGAATRTGVTETEVHVGVTGWFPAGDIGTDLLKAFKAHFAEVNAAGGVHGRQVIVHYEDTGDISAESGVDAARRVENVVLFNCECQGVDNAIGGAQYLEQQGVPHLVTTGTESFINGLRLGYGIAQVTEDFVRRTLEYMAAELGLAGKKIGMIRTNLRAWAVGDEVFEGYGREVGMQPALIRIVELTQPSFINELGAMRSAGVEGILCFCSLELPSVVRDARALRYEPVITSSTGTFDTFAQASPTQLNGIRGLRLGGTTNIQPEYDRYVQAVQRHYPGRVSSDGFIYWGFAQAITAILQHMGTDPTREGFPAAVSRLDNFAAGGSIAPLTFTEGRRIGTRHMLPVRCCNAGHEWVAEGPYSANFLR